MMLFYLKTINAGHQIAIDVYYKNIKKSQPQKILTTQAKSPSQQSCNFRSVLLITPFHHVKPEWQLINYRGQISRLTRHCTSESYTRVRVERLLDRTEQGDTGSPSVMTNSSILLELPYIYISDVVTIACTIYKSHLVLIALPLFVAVYIRIFITVTKSATSVDGKLREHSSEGYSK